MSSIIWTPAALASERRELRLDLWRAVEAQHVVATLALVDNLDEQALLEDILEASKPPIPADARGLHYLLFTPFRYPSPFGSRFRAPTDPGVFYGANEIRTACAESGYWRWRFLQDSPALGELPPRAQTLFRVGVNAQGIALDEPPFDSQANQWMEPSDYSSCQTLARNAREAAIGLIRYTSVRDPQHGHCAAILTPEAFRGRAPKHRQSWHLTVRQDRVMWLRDDAISPERFEFLAADLAGKRPT